MINYVFRPFHNYEISIDFLPGFSIIPGGCPAVSFGAATNQPSGNRTISPQKGRFFRV